MAEILRQGIDTVHRKIIYPSLTRDGGQDDREIAHENAIGLASKLQHFEMVTQFMRKMFAYKNPALRTSVAGVKAPNPLGLAAGFDKNARVHRLLGEGLGFGIVKVGSITKIPYEGNERPRIFDLPNNDGLINRMGFPGEGSDEAEKRLRESYAKRRHYSLIINIAASKPSFETNSQIDDYIAVAEQLLEFGNGHEINVSSPNTEGVQGLQEPEVFTDLAQALKATYLVGESPTHGYMTPFQYKFGPDLEMQSLLRNIKTAKDNFASGISLGNTTTDQNVRDYLSLDRYKNEKGGISGQPLKKKALERSHQVYQEMGEEIDITLIGGIQNASDVWNALTYGGAKAVDVYTAFVRPTTSTPNFAFYILRDLHRAMKAESMSSMADFKDLRGKKVPFPKI